MRIFWSAAAAAVILCGAAQAAEDSQPPANGDAAIGVGLICNTSEQAKQFVKLRTTGAEPEQAMHAVNYGETPDISLACGYMDKIQPGSCAEYHANAPAS